VDRKWIEIGAWHTPLTNAGGSASGPLHHRRLPHLSMKRKHTSADTGRSVRLLTDNNTALAAMHDSLLALSGHWCLHRTCRLSGVKRTWVSAPECRRQRLRLSCRFSAHEGAASPHLARVRRLVRNRSVGTSFTHKQFSDGQHSQTHIVDRLIRLTAISRPDRLSVRSLPYVGTGREQRSTHTHCLHTAAFNSLRTVLN